MHSRDLILEIHFTFQVISNLGFACLNNRPSLYALNIRPTWRVFLVNIDDFIIMLCLISYNTRLDSILGQSETTKRFNQYIMVSLLQTHLLIWKS